MAVWDGPCRTFSNAPHDDPTTFAEAAPRLPVAVSEIGLPRAGFIWGMSAEVASIAGTNETMSAAPDFRAPAFHARRRPEYPALAWVFELEGGGDERRPAAHVGRDVELFDRGLVEGCWDGPFEQYDFRGRINFFGSGAVRAEDGTWWFCPPRHTFEALWVLGRDGRQPLVSTSLPALLAHAGLRLDPHYPGCTRALGTLVAGVDAAEDLVWRSEAHEATLYRMLFHDFAPVGGALPPRTVRPREPAAFDTFGSYRDHLVGTMRLLFANAADPGRSARSRACSPPPRAATTRRR